MLYSNTKLAAAVFMNSFKAIMIANSIDTIAQA